MRYRKIRYDRFQIQALESDPLSADERIILTRDDGEPIGVVLNIEDFRSLEATVALAIDPENLRRALEAERRLDARPFAESYSGDLERSEK